MPETEPPPRSRRTSWLAFAVFSVPLGMFYGGAITAIRGSGWLALDRIGLGFVVLAGTLLALPLFEEGGGALVRWEDAVLRLQEHILGRARSAAKRALRYSVAGLLTVTLLAVDAGISHSSGGRFSHGFALYFVGLVWVGFVLAFVALAALLAWLVSRDPRTEGPQFRDLFRIVLEPPRREITVAFALFVFLLGSVLQYLSLGHESPRPAPAPAALSATSFGAPAPSAPAATRRSSAPIAPSPRGR